VIGFIGLVAPQMVRRIIGGDHRFLIPISALMGALLLLVSDTFARTIISPIILPVGAVTSFLGAPLFLYLLLKGGKRR
jgi:iron complex transport system permease protein